MYDMQELMVPTKVAVAVVSSLKAHRQIANNPPQWVQPNYRLFKAHSSATAAATAAANSCSVYGPRISPPIRICRRSYQLNI